MTFGRYSKYKSVNVSWIGEIPFHWGFQSIKSILVERNEKNNPIKTKDILSLTMDRGVIPYAERGGGGNKAKEDISSYKLAYPDDIVLNSMNVVAGSVGLSKYFGAVSPVYYMLYARHKDVNIGYYDKIFSSTAFQKSLLGLGNGILMKETELSGKLNTIRMKIPIDKLNIQYLPCPPLEEQLKITKFLDVNISKIDELIQKQEKLIDLLRERKKQISLKTLTQGVKKSSFTRESGLWWVPTIPSNWGLCALKRIANLRSGSSITAEHIEAEGHYPVFGGGGLRGYTSKFTHDGIYPLIGRQGALCGNVNFSEGKFWASEHAVVVTPIKNINTTWLGLLLEAMNLGQYSMSAAQPGLSVDVIKNLVIPIPPHQEQIEISNFLIKEHSKIELLIEKSQYCIALLKERRDSLILAAVTGKIMVSE